QKYIYKQQGKIFDAMTGNDIPGRFMARQIRRHKESIQNLPQDLADLEATRQWRHDKRLKAQGKVVKAGKSLGHGFKRRGIKATREAFREGQSGANVNNGRIQARINNV